MEESCLTRVDTVGGVVGDTSGVSGGGGLRGSLEIIMLNS